MIKRIDKVYYILNKIWDKKESEEILDKGGSTTKEVATLLNISRSNCSNDLNNLVKEGKIVKITGYPVKFIPTSTLKKNKLFIPKQFITSKLKRINDLSIENDPFNNLIGGDQSLRKAVKQAKAAILYLPHGLNMLILGPTGSGKTYFSKIAYLYSIYKHQIDKNAPFIVFNCADYYNNSQLLLSQLFGRIKGAYTGAETDNKGVVEQADGGILLLDEVHRLPPEGQEMLFTFMDTGYFSRLGETKKNRKAQVLIIAATNENPESNLLETFRRRIPTTIKIPPLSEKGLREQIQLINFLFRSEAARIKRDIDVNSNVIESILLNNNYGNIGQLKSEIQLICARAFLNSMNNNEDITVNDSCLTEELQKININKRTNIGLSEQLAKLVPQHSIYSADSASKSIETEDNIYSELNKQVTSLEKQGIPSKNIQTIVMDKLYKHVNNFLKTPVETSKLQNFISPQTLNLTKKLKIIAERDLNTQFDQSFLYYIGMHIDAYLNKNNRKTNLLMPEQIKSIKEKKYQEYHVAKKFSLEIFNYQEIVLPDIEVIYLTLLLSSLRQLPSEKIRKINILVISHGNSTASSMVNVATELLNANNVFAIDMPLNVAPNKIVSTVIHKINTINISRGILILVDMGSLVHMKAEIEKKVRIPIKIMPFVNTLLLLDAVRKTSYVDLNLDKLFNSIKNDFIENVNASFGQLESNLPKAILSICMTGSGTAEKLKTIIVNIINENTSELIQVKTVSALTLKNEIPNLKREYNILATVGTKNPRLSVPHISLESLIGGMGEKELQSIITNHDSISSDTESPYPLQNRKASKNIVVKDICLDVLKKNLIYLNPFLIVDTLMSWLKDLSLQLNKSLSNTVLIKCIVHTSIAFERAITGDSLNYPEKLGTKKMKLFGVIKNSLIPYESQLKIKLTEDELKIITEIIFDETSR